MNLYNPIWTYITLYEHWTGVKSKPYGPSLKKSSDDHYLKIPYFSQLSVADIKNKSKKNGLIPLHHVNPLFWSLAFLKKSHSRPKQIIKEILKYFFEILEGGLP